MRAYLGEELGVDDDDVARGDGLAEVDDDAQVVEVEGRGLHLVLAHACRHAFGRSVRYIMNKGGGGGGEVECEYI